MKIKILLTLLLITILSLIISSGCGGGSGTNQPSSLVTKTPNSSDNMAYITIKVKWPEQGMAGKLIMSSSDNEEKDITASMPPDAKKIMVKIFNFKDKNENDPIDFSTDILLAEGQLPEPDTQITIPIKVPIINNPSNTENPNILPAIPVKVWAGCYTDPDATAPDSALSTSEHYMVLKVGEQAANLNLGNYSIRLIPTTPAPSEICEAVITTNLSIVYPTPTGTPAPAPSPKSIGGRKIKFKVESVTYTGTGNVIVTPDDIEVNPELITDPNGNCRALVTLVKADIKPVKATIKATLVGLDGQDTDISNICEVYLGNFYFWTCVSPDLIPSGEKVLRKYDSSGKQVNALIDIGDDPNQLRYPSSLAIDSSGNFYIAENRNYSIKKFDSDGKFLNMWSNCDSVDICTDSKDNVYVSVQSGYNKIRKYDSNGTLSTSWNVTQPNSIDCDSEQNIYVADAGIQIVKFDCNGTLMKNWYLNDEKYGSGIVVDKIRKYVYVACFYPSSEIQKFDLDGNFLLRFAIEDQVTSSPDNLGVDQNGDVYNNSYDYTQNQSVIKKYSHDSGELVKELLIWCNNIIFVSN